MARTLPDGREALEAACIAPLEVATLRRLATDSPANLREIGTAGSVKTQLAQRILDDGAAKGQLARYVCFNRPLADHLTQFAPPKRRGDDLPYVR